MPVERRAETQKQSPRIVRQGRLRTASIQRHHALKKLEKEIEEKYSDYYAIKSLSENS